MYFTQINFSGILPSVTMYGFVVTPIKEGKIRHNPEKTVISCEPQEATAWAVSAVVDNDDREWIADFKFKEDADTFTALCAALYRAGKNDRPKLWSIEVEGDGVIVGAIEEGANLESRLQKALAQHFNGEVTHLSGLDENRNYQKQCRAIVRAEGETDEVFNGVVTLTPIPIYTSEG